MKMRDGFQKITHGPHGSGDSINWSIETGRINKIMIKHGGIVDGIGFQIGETQLWFTGTGGVKSEVTLGREEYITHISGTKGRWGNKHHVTSLKIHTNVRPGGYGPFGAAGGSEKSSFTTPLIQGHAIIGFCGRIGNFLESIGASTRPISCGKELLVCPYCSAGTDNDEEFNR